MRGATQSDTQVELKRSLSLPLITFYGLGTIIGAGIYVLVGEVARIAGPALPLAFLVAGVLATLTAMSYAELSARYPRSAGAALYVDIAFGNARLSQVVGLMLILTGVVSAATITRGFYGYLDVYVDIPESLAIILLGASLCAVACWGMAESAWLIAGITLLEAGGLVYATGVAATGPPPAEFITIFSNATPMAVVLGAFLAFYAFVGFEDMVNVAEEVKNPQVNLPRAILLSLGLSTLIYAMLSVAAVLFVSIDDLIESPSPLTVIVGREPAISIISAIGLVAVINGALAQIIMAARVLYGMARRGRFPGFFASIHPRTQTPVFNTVLVSTAVVVLALTVPLVQLAQVTSAITLAVFALVNASLVVIQRREPPSAAFTVPHAVPIIGVVASLGLLAVATLSPAAGGH